MDVVKSRLATYIAVQYSIAVMLQYVRLFNMIEVPVLIDQQGQHIGFSDYLSLLSIRCLAVTVDLHLYPWSKTFHYVYVQENCP